MMPLRRRAPTHVLARFLVLILLVVQAFPVALRHHCDYFGWHEHLSSSHDHDHGHDHHDQDEESETEDSQIVLKLASQLLASFQLLSCEAFVTYSEIPKPLVWVVFPLESTHLANASPFPHLKSLNSIRLLI